MPGQTAGGIALGLGGATWQASGIVLGRPVMAGGADPLLAMLVRGGDADLVATLAFLTPIVPQVLLWPTTRGRHACLTWCGAALVAGGAVALVRH